MKSDPSPEEAIYILLLLLCVRKYIIKDAGLLLIISFEINLKGAGLLLVILD